MKKTPQNKEIQNGKGFGDSFFLKKLQVKLLYKIIFCYILSEFGASVIYTVCVTYKCQRSSQKISPVIYLMYGTCA